MCGEIFGDAWSTSLWFSKISWDPCTFDCFLIFKITLDCQFFNYFYEHQDDKCSASNILELIENDKVNVWDCGRLNWNHKKIPLIYLFYVTDPLIFNAICITSASSNIVLSNHIYHWWWLEYITLSSPKISWDPCTFDCYLISKITLDCLSKISIVWTHKPFILASILDMFLDMSLRISNIWLTCFDIFHSFLLWSKLWNVLDMNNFELDAKIDFYKEVFFLASGLGEVLGVTGKVYLKKMT